MAQLAGRAVSARRKIATRYEVPNTGGLVVINYRQEPHAWYVTTAGSRRCTMRHRRQPPGPHAHATYRRAILPPFRCYGSAVLAARYLPGPPPKPR